MQYIVFDLEWNTVYVAQEKVFDEIIEIGAVKLNDDLSLKDEFSRLVCPAIGKKISKYCSEKTKIEIDDLKRDGVSFQTAINEFSNWCDDPNQNIFLTWSDTDLYTLAHNMKKFFESADVDFIKKYIDAQKYCEQFMDIYDGAHSISLNDAAHYFNIEIDESSLHRAINDSKLAAECFSRVYKKENIDFYQIDCDNGYFKKLIFHPFYITTPQSKWYNLYKEKFYCPVCSSLLSRTRKFCLVNKSFNANFLCKKCSKKYYINVVIKRTFDGVEITKKYSRLKSKKKKKKVS